MRSLDCLQRRTHNLYSFEKFSLVSSCLHDLWSGHFCKRYNQKQQKTGKYSFELKMMQKSAKKMVLLNHMSIYRTELTAVLGMIILLLLTSNDGRTSPRSFAKVYEKTHDRKKRYIHVHQYNDR